jgi:hypothetical protein
MVLKKKVKGIKINLLHEETFTTMKYSNSANRLISPEYNTIKINIFIR